MANLTASGASSQAGSAFTPLGYALHPMINQKDNCFLVAFRCFRREIVFLTEMKAMSKYTVHTMPSGASVACWPSEAPVMPHPQDAAPQTWSLPERPPLPVLRELLCEGENL